MGEPVSLGAALMAGSSVLGGASQKGQADYQAAVAQNNAKLARIQAQQEIARGRQEKHIRGLKGKQAEGSLRAEAAARGVVVDEGSAQVGVEDIAEATARDSANIIIDAERRALGLEQEAVNFEAEAEAKKAEGNSALFGSILSASGQVASDWGGGAASSGAKFSTGGNISQARAYSKRTGTPLAYGSR